jgi:hypothetical protein
MDSLEMNKKYKEEKRKILSDRKRASDIEKRKTWLSKKVATQKKTVANDKVSAKHKSTGEKEVFERVRKNVFTFVWFATNISPKHRHDALHIYLQRVCIQNID